MKKLSHLTGIFLLTFILTGCEANNHAPPGEVVNAPAKTEPTETISKTGVTISDAWVRANAPGQSVGAAYMTLNSPQDSTLVYAETEAAGAVEIHSMTMENDVMKMRMLEALTLKANQPEKLAPGGLHLMLFNLPKPLTAGESVKFRLCFKGATGEITDQLITVPVKEAE